MTKRGSTERKKAMGDDQTAGRDKLYAILAVLGASALFPAAGVAIQACKTIPASEMFLVRSLVGCSICVFKGLMEKKSLFGPKQAQPWIWARGFLGAAGAQCFFLALGFLPIGNVTSVVATYPAITIICGYCFLGENLDMITCINICMTIAGAALIAQPSFLFGTNEGSQHDAFQKDMAYLLCIVASSAFGSMFFFAKKASLFGDMNLEMLFSFNISAMVLSLLLAYSVPAQKLVFPTSFFEYFAMSFVAICGFLVQASYNYGSNHLDASLVAVISVTEGFFAFLWQMLIFRQQSDTLAYVGAFMVTVCVGIICFRKGMGHGGGHSKDNDDIEYRAAQQTNKLLANHHIDSSTAGYNSFSSISSTPSPTSNRVLDDSSPSAERTNEKVVVSL
mmetsp:Transcript_2144/g.3091  ORF Transcript_2144/g.3091 Transcript_2144/m.3091 type:complete len:392 (-) Transcript_2144:122-1297(-)